MLSSVATLAGIGLALFGAERASAQVILTPTVTQVGNLFRYEYSIANNSDLELLLVDLQTLMRDDAIQNAVAPTGFQVVFDSGLGLVSFLPDADDTTLETFAPGSVVSGFQFDSPLLPDNALFQALAFDDLNGQIVNFAGTTVGPTAVPEPGAVALGIALGFGSLLALRRRSRSAR
jgi:hypothetical protein